MGPVGAYLPVPFTSAPPVGLQRADAGRLGHSDQQITTVSGGLVSEIVAHGDPGSIAAAVAAHRAAGADHVILMPPGAVDRDLAEGVRQLERLAPAVLQA